MELKIEKQTKGVRIISGEQAKLRRRVLNKMIEMAEEVGFDEIILPCIEPSEVYTDKAGPEVLGQMYVFEDKKGRELCLRPEGTATIQLIANKTWKGQKDVKVFYFERCWRYERPQAGRYREFFQFGVEWINPRDQEQAKKELIELAERMIGIVTEEYVVSDGVKRGLDYYIEDGFEIEIPSLGAQKQVLGGGAYKEGIGFAIGFDRLLLNYDELQLIRQRKRKDLLQRLIDKCEYEVGDIVQVGMGAYEIGVFKLFENNDRSLTLSFKQREDSRDSYGVRDIRGMHIKKEDREK